MKKCAWTVLLALVLGVFLTSNGLWAQGKFEIELQGGVWTLKPVLNYFADQPWQKANEQNFGISVRYKPRQSFSIGLSYQRIRAEYSFSTLQVDRGVVPIWDSIHQKTLYFDLNTEERESVRMSGDMVLLDLRWEIKPSWLVHPYFTFGVGALFPKITDDYYTAKWYIDTTYNNYKCIWDESTDGNFVDLQQSVLPVLELMFGLKAELIKKKLALGLEGGFLDGLVYRGALSFRF
jgi:hypothetical protein